VDWISYYCLLDFRTIMSEQKATVVFVLIVFVLSDTLFPDWFPRALATFSLYLGLLYPFFFLDRILSSSSILLNPQLCWTAAHTVFLCAKPRGCWVG